MQHIGVSSARLGQVQVGTPIEIKGGEQGMESNTIIPLPVLNRNSSDDEILGLLTQPPRRTGRGETKSEVHDSSAQDSTTRADDQLAMEFGDEVDPRTRRDSATAMLSDLNRMDAFFFATAGSPRGTRAGGCEIRSGCVCIVGARDERAGE